MQQETRQSPLYRKQRHILQMIAHVAQARTQELNNALGKGRMGRNKSVQRRGRKRFHSDVRECAGIGAPWRSVERSNFAKDVPGKGVGKRQLTAFRG